MAKCAGRTCKLIMYQVTNLQITTANGTAATRAAPPSTPCGALNDAIKADAVIAIKKKLETPTPLEESTCPNGCACVPRENPDFEGKPTTTHRFSTTYKHPVPTVPEVPQRYCFYRLEGQYDKAFDIVDGVCTDLDEDLGEVSLKVVDAPRKRRRKGSRIA